eukprot:Gregarina_sp_Pseudo_9__1628@NODE_2097_length_1154_cov_46_468161_g1935_i0_p1_GENE_NODE_2097_length_1154_cov_46_468161_g1935_i0NODE_2097_length_1154_cov_46_468161_g1935_i0_p1_ORF_typecomplete_len290_score20_70_NODE_2097_length_1154_cov_46_468161_g1935_i0107976
MLLLLIISVNAIFQVAGWLQDARMEFHLNPPYVTPFHETEVSLHLVADNSEVNLTGVDAEWSWDSPFLEFASRTSDRRGSRVWLTLASNFAASESDFARLQVTLDSEPPRTAQQVVLLLPYPSASHPAIKSTEKPPAETLLTSSSPRLGCTFGVLDLRLVGEVAWNDFEDFKWLEPEERFMPGGLRLRFSDSWPVSRLADLLLTLPDCDQLIAHVQIERGGQFCLNTKLAGSTVDTEIMPQAAYEAFVVSAVFSWCWRFQVFADPVQIWFWFRTGLSGAPRHYAWVFAE